MNDISIDKLVKQAFADGIEEFAVGSAIEREGLVLILVRSENETFLPRYAQLPSGGVDEGETILEALLRETSEETGLTILEILAHTGSFDYVSERGRKARQLNFLVRTEDFAVRLNPAEHSDFHWISPHEDLSMLLFTPEMQQSIRDLGQSIHLTK